MKTVGIKIADGSFYPIMEEGTPQQKLLNLTTAHNNQTCVMVDLYRSENCSMDDAEYIDTLKIDNLIGHPNGEPNISFSVGLDENGELTANIQDPETGATSNSSITLVSRTMEERLVPDDYTIEENTSAEPSSDDLETKETSTLNGKKAGLGIAAGGAGLLAAAALLNKNHEDKTEASVNSDTMDYKVEPIDLPKFDEIENGFEDTFSNNGSDDFDINDIPDFGDITLDTTDEVPNFDDITLDNTDDHLADATENLDVTAEQNNGSDDFDINDIPDFGDITLDSTDETPNFDDITLDNADETSDFDDITLDNTDDSLADATENLDVTAEQNNGSDDFDINDIPDFGDIQVEDVSTEMSDLDDFTTEEKTDETPDFGNITIDNADETSGFDDITVDSIDETPDFDDVSLDNSSEEIPDFGDITLDTTDEIPNFDDNSLDTTDEVPNFDDNSLDTTDKVPNFDDTDSFDIPDFEESAQNSGMDDNFGFTNNSFDDTSDNLGSAGGLSFTGLYDKETEMGDSSVHTREKKNTRTPMIICVICAVICLLATALLLFVVPSKYNLLARNGEESSKEKTIVEDTSNPVLENALSEKEPEIPTDHKETVPQAKENEIVIIEKAEEVVPLPPPVPVVEEKPKVITYKIKWGDTLWDIADTYYKNPWRYKKIASYNNIQNPDHIVSGTTILIPAE